MNRIRDILNKHLFRGIFIGMLAILLLRMTGTNALALALTCGQWNVVSSPNTGTSPQLNGVAAISAKNIWAVGGDYGNNTPLIEHWTGKKWRIVSSPGTGILNGVAAVSAKDIWAVGNVTSYHTFIQHWDGTSWSIVPSPNTEALEGVAAVSATDVWAVGNKILHWDGTQWSYVPSPSITMLYGITAISATDVWAVGYELNNGERNSLTVHWDGTQWSIVPSPNPPNEYCVTLQGTTAIATNDVWAVGWYNDDCNVPPTTSFAEHWDGTQWSIDSILGTSSQLFGVAARSTNDVWAVGNTRGQITLTYHWDGSSWSQVPDPNVKNSNFYGVAVTPKGDFWAVGESDSGTLTEFYC
jgi:hypothetical protein